jgi:hypothetical protein
MLASIVTIGLLIRRFASSDGTSDGADGEATA